MFRVSCFDFRVSGFVFRVSSFGVRGSATNPEPRDSKQGFHERVARLLCGLVCEQATPALDAKGIEMVRREARYDVFSQVSCTPALSLTAVWAGRGEGAGGGNRCRAKRQQLRG